MNGDYSVGPLTYESYEDYREYGVGFYATQEQLDTFVAAVEAKGLDYDYWVSVSATDSLFELPKSISSILLPQVGMVDFNHSIGYTIQALTSGYDDVDFDLSSDTLPTEYCAAWFNYCCAVNQDAIDYAQQLKDLGWEVVWESDGEDGYRCCLQKDGIYAISNYYDYDCMLEVGFSDMVENLSY